MIARFLSVGFAALLTTSAAVASELPPYAGSHDDAAYGDVPRASFDAQLPRPDGVSVVGSRFDDTRYAAPVEASAPRALAGRHARDDARTPCTCKA